jgi:hypothetical protein
LQEVATAAYPFGLGNEVKGKIGNTEIQEPDSGSTTASCVHNGVFQTTAKLQWHQAGLTNCNGVNQKHEIYSGVYPINPKNKQLDTS